MDIVAARLPGRDGRFTEQPATTFEPLLEQLLDSIEPFAGTRFTLFGHSMGGLLAYELGRRLEAEGRPPTSVVIAGTASPLLTAPTKPLDDDALLAGLRRDGIVSAALMANDELMRLLLPILRADLRVVEDYRFDRSRPVLRAPLRLYYGKDEIPDPARLAGEWAGAVDGEPRLHGFPGGHFFVRTAVDAVLRQLTDHIELTGASR